MATGREKRMSREIMEIESARYFSLMQLGVTTNLIDKIKQISTVMVLLCFFFSSLERMLGY